MVTTTISPCLRKDARPEEDAPLVLVSSRGPIEHYVDSLGRIRQREAGGGVAVALRSVARSRPVSWVAAACSFADQVVALTGRRVPLANGGSLRLVPLPDEVRRAYYGVFCNPILWFVQHALDAELLRSDLAGEAIESWQTGYVPANKLFAEAVIAEIDRAAADARVMLNDYHLYLAPRLIRRARPQTVLQQFVHIPWPEPSAWLKLPDDLVREICAGLLANDSAFFQTEADGEAFLATCRAYLSGAGAAVDERRREVVYLGRTTSVWSNPISVDVAELRQLAASPEAAQYGAALDRLAGRRTIVRVDRLDPSKNVLRGFQAYDLLLERRPKLRGRVSFLAFLVPSRAGIPEYDDYTRRVFETVD
ncbi:MAG TPA: trehalose-6-phosphate synthase, partial [Dehalococcoidia bacterium]